jgi:uncharacterized protein involved in outer membrane biogenesis
MEFNLIAGSAQQAVLRGRQETFMNNGLLFFGGLLVLVFSALFAVPTLVDWNGYRGVFEEEASKVLGRDVRVGGSVNLRFLPAPYVQFDKVRISNVSGQTGEPFVRADSFKMWLSASALLRGVLEASEIELSKPVLTLVADKSGGGNWSNITLRSADLPFVPRELALKSVKLSDATISLYNAAAGRIAHVESINGELSADGLTGPFRFKGDASWLGLAHAVAFATEPPARDGSFGLKISIRSKGSRDVYLLNGRIGDLAGNPSFKGEWTGTLAMPVEGVVTAEAAKDDATLLDLKANVSGDMSGAKFDDIALSFNASAAPQMVTGSAVATWAEPARLDLKLASKWLDIDRLAGAGQGSASFSKLKELGIGLMQTVAGDSTASTKINLEQVKIGGETAGGLDIDADRSGNITRINNFNISLPGGSRLDLAGNLKTDRDGKQSFSGDLFVGGTSLSRLKDWAGKSGVPIDITSDGPFSLSGKLDIDETRFAIADASAEISGRAFSGDLAVVRGARVRTDLTLQAAELDTREIFPETANAVEAALRKALGLALPDSESKNAGEQPEDVRLRVIAGRLTDHGNTYRDVDVTFETEGKEIRLPAAKVTTDRGLKISLEGRVKENETGPFGTLAYDVVAPTPEAMGDLVRRAGLALQFGDERFKGLESAKLAGLITLGRRAPAASDVTFDGTVNGSHFGGSANFDGGFGAWRSQPSRLQVTAKAPSLQALLAMLAQARPTEKTTPDAPADASLIAAGTLASGAKARFEMRGQGFDLTFSGTAVLPENSALALNGVADVKADDLADVAGIAGLSLPAGAATVATRGTLDIIRGQDAWSIATRDLVLGTASVTAFLDLKSGDDGRRRIEGRIGADRVAVETLITALTDKTPMPPDGGEADAEADAPAVSEWRAIWPSGVFNFAALKGIDADIRISFASLALGGDLATRDGEMHLAIAPGKITVSNLSAAAAGGKLRGQLSLDKASNGVKLASDLTLDGAKLSAFSSTARGTATFQLAGEATAQSPAGLIAVLSGKGHATLSDARVRGPTTAVLSDIVDTVLRGKMQNDVRPISAALLTSLSTSEVSLGDRDIAITLADGTVKFNRLTLDSEEGKLDATVSADLTSLKVSAALQVTPTAKPVAPPNGAPPGWKPAPSKGPLPPAIILYDGPLDNLAILKSSVDVADLQRELSVRQVERNVEELELSRRLDEERVRAERERRKALDAQRAQAAKKQSETLPPVIPEASGTADGNQSEINGSSGEVSSTTGDAPAAGANEAKQGGAEPNSAHILDGQKITVEPIPDTEGIAAQSSAGQVDPETGLPVPSKSEGTVRPATTARPVQRPREKRRTSSDEVMKQLGGFPY